MYCLLTALPSDSHTPLDSFLSLTKVFVCSYGYRGRDARSNLCVLPSSELVYFVATFVVVYDRLLDRQRHYTEHNEEVTWYSL